MLVHLAACSPVSAPPGLTPVPFPRPAAGSAGCRRLAARLVPRYARCFPQHSATAADALIGLAALSLAGANAGVCQTTCFLLALPHGSQLQTVPWLRLTAGTHWRSS